ncbi:MAG: threonylcarbamoyl-AMP synthase, partial [Chlorobiales bacterium]|nr:threonylcarbamoyl-AMP synthase [Chlorobiales bacterium]
VSVAAPSANLSGKPSPTTWQAAKDDLDGKISCILKGDQSDVGLESTIVDCTGKMPMLLRAGAITFEQLQEVIPGIQVESPAPDTRPKSPGQKYRHYAPNASIILVDHPSEIVSSPFAAYIGIENNVSASKVKISNICPSVNEYARSLFEFFRYCDAHQIQIIYCQRVASTGLGLALMDRISRAAQH